MQRLVGREHEQAAIEELIVSVRGGLSRALVVRGELGVGKTALLEASIASADDFEIVRLVGIESEMQLGFAGLHQLLKPFLGGIDDLPGPQARALSTVFGLIEDESVPDPFLIGLAVLTLLADIASRGAVLVVVDDAQWLDVETANVLGFVARRFFADRVGILIAVRDPSDHHPTFDQLPILALGALSDGPSNAILDSRVDGPLAESVRARILAGAGGNPLALVELSRELSRDHLAGAEVLPDPLPVGKQLESRFLHQVRALPLDTQRLLLVLAAEPTGDLALVFRAGDQLDFDHGALDRAMAEDLITLGPSVLFRHPIIRSVIYHRARDVDRRRTHEVLAACTADADRQAWHRSCAAIVADESVAAELELAAQRAQSRGGYAATAALMLRAAQLTPEPTQRAFRFLGASAAELTVGNSTAAYASLQQALPDLDKAVAESYVRRLEAGIFFIEATTNAGSDELSASGRPEDPDHMMIDAALALGPLDIRAARETMMDALPMTIYLSESTSTSAADAGLAALTLALPRAVAPTSSDLVLDALSQLFAHGFGRSVPLLRDALAAVQADPSVREVLRVMALACWIAFAVGDDGAVQSLAGELLEVSRDRGASTGVGEALSYLGQTELRHGSLDTAEALFAEEIALDTLFDRQSSGAAFQLVVSAWRGREDLVRTTAPVLKAEARDRKLGLIVALAEYAEVVLELGLGNYRAASQRPIPQWNEDVALGALRAADAIEAHARAGDTEVARASLAWLAERALATGNWLDLGLHARSSALLCDEPEAERNYRAALEHFDADGRAVHLARTQLLFGEWLRRQKRRRDAREQLGPALDSFESVGADGFAERTRIELRATGTTARKRDDDTRHDLTAQETQIMRLAASGLTNADIATRLYISANTVDYHLRKVYRKLGVTSRHDLSAHISGAT